MIGTTEKPPVTIPQRVYPTAEPRFAQRDPSLLQHLRTRCVTTKWIKDPETQQPIEVIDKYLYKDILDAIEMLSSHLLDASYLDDAQAIAEYSYWRGRYLEPKISKYIGLNEGEAIDILVLLIGWTHNVIFGRAHQGMKAKYLTELAGARQTYKFEESEPKKRGLGGIIRGR